MKTMKKEDAQIISHVCASFQKRHSYFAKNCWFFCLYIYPNMIIIIKKMWTKGHMACFSHDLFPATTTTAKSSPILIFFNLSDLQSLVMAYLISTCSLKEQLGIEFNVPCVLELYWAIYFLRHSTPYFQQLFSYFTKKHPHLCRSKG